MNDIVCKLAKAGQLLSRTFAGGFQQRMRAYCWTRIGSSLDVTNISVR